MRVVSTTDVEIVGNKNAVKSTEVKVEQKRNRSIDIIREDVIKKLTCCNTWRCRGCSMFLLLVCVTIFYVILLVVYSASSDGVFALLSRPYVWTFLVMTVLYILEGLWFIIRWKH